MKKFLSLILSLMLVASLVACTSSKPAEETTTGGEETKEETTGGEAKTYKVGVTIYKFDDNFMTLYRNEIENYFASLNTDTVKYEVTTVDGKNDANTQSQQVDDFITQGYDVVIVNAVMPSAADTILAKCVEADVPCIFINREPAEEIMTSEDGGDYAGKLTYVCAVARQSGRMQGEIIADLENKGDLNGDGKLQYVMVVGDPENVDAQYRTQYSIEQYLESSGLEVECLVEERGMWDQAKGQEIAANALAQYGDKIEVIFCNNDGMALGAKQAIDEAGRKVGEDIYLVGVDALADAVDLIVKGEMTGTVLNDHVGQSHTAVDCAIKALNGEKLDNYYWVDYVKVTADNAADFQ